MQVEEKEDIEESKLSIAHVDSTDDSNDIWFVDSGFSNHMCGLKDKFKELEEFHKMVRLKDNKVIQVEGKGIVAVQTSHGKIKLIYDVYFVPNLAHNLLSVGQLMTSGYSILFNNGLCAIKDNLGQMIANICMTANKMFPLEVSEVHNFALVANAKDELKLWHLRYEHLNVNGLKLLSEKSMVLELHKINSLDLCETCVYGKQARHYFPVGVSWRAKKCLELIHADLCGLMNIESFGGSQYFLLFTNDYSRMSWIYFLKFN